MTAGSTGGRVALIGGGGRIGSGLGPALVDAGFAVEVHDLKPPLQPDPRLELRIGDAASPDALDGICQRCDTVIYLAGSPDSDDWDILQAFNIDLPRRILEPLAERGLRRLIFASSLHVSGMLTTDVHFDSLTPLRPDSRYAVTKLYGEALVSMLADKHGVEVFILRIGTCRERPTTRRELTTWLSPGDLSRLVQACLKAPAGVADPIWAFSNNAALKIDRSPWAALGYEPLDDAQSHAIHLEAADVGAVRLGGRFCEF